MRRRKYEHWCSKEIAILLKQKKFKFTSDYGYPKNEDKLREFIADDGHGGWYDNPREFYDACQLGMIVEMMVDKGVLISITPGYSANNVFYIASVYLVDKFDSILRCCESLDYNDCLEKAITYCLENVDFK